MPTSSIVSIFGSQTSEDIFALPYSDATTDSDIVSDDDLLIALRKGKHACTFHSISRFVFYLHLPSSFHAFIFL